MENKREIKFQNTNLKHVRGKKFKNKAQIKKTLPFQIHRVVIFV